VHAQDLAGKKRAVFLGIGADGNDHVEVDFIDQFFNAFGTQREGIHTDLFQYL
jgi:hypothetical protein